MSRITSHILDTSKGKPAVGVMVTLYQWSDDWQLIGTDVTNNDGRVTALPDVKIVVDNNIFKLKFETKTYFENNNLASFYPYIEIIFAIKNDEHYHVPLLLNPFGYSTYRGS